MYTKFKIINNGIYEYYVIKIIKTWIRIRTCNEIATCGSTSMMFNLKKFANTWTKLGVNCKLVADIDIVEVFQP